MNTISKIEFEEKLNELLHDEDPAMNFVTIQMFTINKFALDTGIFSKDEYEGWRKKIKHLEYSL